MSTDLQPANGQALGSIETVLATGDLSKLSTEERTRYLLRVCETLHLNPLTRPFQYITLSGRLVLYATRDAADQLRKLHRVSIRITARDRSDDLIIVQAEATDAAGRTDTSLGVVSTAGLRGEALANALMKAETKAKRRVTLSICGLGMLDETEVETVPGAVRVEQPALPALAPPATAADLAGKPTTGDPVTPAQLKKLFATVHEQNWSEDDVRRVMGDLWGVTSSRALSKHQASLLIDLVEGRLALTYDETGKARIGQPPPVAQEQ